MQTPQSALPKIIQGGMGIAVSDWKLARTVSRAGELGVVSGTAINQVLVRRLQDGDPGGHMRRALAAFPSQTIANQVLNEYFIEGGRPAFTPYKRSQLFSLKPPLALSRLTVLASFVETHLAKEGHDGWVGFNLLEKVQLPNLASLYGAVLAGVDVVIIGAGIPREIPGVLDLLSENRVATLKIPVVGADADAVMSFDPREIMGDTKLKAMKRPLFFPIVSSSVLAQSLKKKSNGKVDGFVVEGPLAGGHNAPPRGPLKLNELGEPVYGPRDVVNLDEMKELGLPFWIAGHAATPENLIRFQAVGAHGIQVGTLFAFSQESGLDLSLKRRVIERIASGDQPKNGWVFTDPVSSPTGFPFKAVRLDGSMSEADVYQKRKRICDLGFLRHAYQKTDQSIGFRCSAEPVEDFEKKGGSRNDTVGKKCLCNALMADIGMAQVQAWGTELPLLTAGDDLNFLNRILMGRLEYSALDVLSYLKFELSAGDRQNQHQNQRGESIASR